MVTLKRVKIIEKQKNKSKPVKLLPKTSENHSKKRVIFPKRVKIDPKEWISLFAELTEGQPFCF